MQVRSPPLADLGSAWQDTIQVRCSTAAAAAVAVVSSEHYYCWGSNFESTPSPNSELWLEMSVVAAAAALDLHSWRLPDP